MSLPSSTDSTLFLPNSVPDEFKSDSFFQAIKAAKITLGSIETGLSAKSEFELYFETGPKQLDISILHKRAQNVDIRYSKIRSVYWKVFLFYLSNNRSSWSSELKSKRNNYQILKDKYINSTVQEDITNLANDNPLASSSGGAWDKYFEDTQLRDTITLDIDRTYPEDDFFINKIVQNSLTDILFIYCKENQWISYKQGMNEIIAALFMINTVQSTISPYVDDDAKIVIKKINNNKTDNIDQNTVDNDDKPSQNTVDDQNTDNKPAKPAQSTQPAVQPVQPTQPVQAQHVSNVNNTDNPANNDQNDNDTPDTPLNNGAATATNTKKISLWEEVQDIRYIEHDTYFMFTEIMSIMGQYFINAGGNDVPPVVERSKRIQGQFLRQMDARLAQHLAKINLTPQLYGLRWIRLFFSREFHLRDVCIVWDSIFATFHDRKHKKIKQQSNSKKKNNDNKIKAVNPLQAIENALGKPRKIKIDFRFIDYMSCSMLLFIRHQLIDRDITHCLRRVMRYPPIEDVGSLIERAYTIRDQIERRKPKRSTKSSLGANLNITDRWNQFSKTVSSAMTTYAEDVKNLMGGQRRTLKSRMQFERALGTKMGEILDRVQNVITATKLLNASSASSLSPFVEIKSPGKAQAPTPASAPASAPAPAQTQVKSNGSNRIDIKTSDNKIISDPLTSGSTNGNDNTLKQTDDDPLTTVTVTSVMDDPLGAMNGDKDKDNDDDEMKDEKQNDNDDDNINKKKENINPLAVIEEALAELKLVKDALLGNLDETQLESWLNWTFIEPSPEPSSISSMNRNRKKLKSSPYQSKQKGQINKKSKPVPPPRSPNLSGHPGHRRNLSSSGLPPPRKNISKPPNNKSPISKSASALLSKSTKYDT